jgi:hypothetical protein
MASNLFNPVHRQKDAWFVFIQNVNPFFMHFCSIGGMLERHLERHLV